MFAMDLIATVTICLEHKVPKWQHIHVHAFILFGHMETPMPFSRGSTYHIQSNEYTCPGAFD